MKNNFRDKKWIGQRFGKLIVLDFTVGKRGKTQWVCQCDCGNTITRYATAILDGHSTSCGCAFRERRHGLAYDENGKINRLYSVWTTMRSRCNNPNDSSYTNYGGRGINVCDEWDSYPNFHAWAINNGYDPTAPWGKCTLDRIDVNENYSPNNCRWVDMKTQAKNKRSPQNSTTRNSLNEETLLTIIDMAEMALNGFSLRDIAKKHNVSAATVYRHLTLKSEKEAPSM